MDIRELQRHWDTFGRLDPFWAILTDPAKRGHRWSPDEFFATGRQEIDELLGHAARFGRPQQWGTALDFGCGAGRLTQALATRFASAVGVDVAPSMVALAREHNRHGERCVYHVNSEPDLARWADRSCDLIYTSRVLQHMAPRYSTAYVREFVRLLAPGGFLSFDLPSGSGDAAALADGTLAVSAMRANLRFASSDAVEVAPGAPVPVTVHITNASHATWSQAPGHPINVGNHWLDADGVMVQQDDQRVRLATPLAPGASTTVTLVAQAPTSAGLHRLQVDVVQEGVAWFGQCGSQVAELVVRVRQDATSGGGAGVLDDTSAGANDDGRPSSPDGFEPVMEMHAVPRADVEALMHECGATVLDVRRVYHCGPLWLAYRYDVTR